MAHIPMTRSVCVSVGMLSRKKVDRVINYGAYNTVLKVQIFFKMC